MIRYAFAAAAAALMTVGAVSELSAQTIAQKVTIDKKTGDYCLRMPAVTGSLIAQSECHSAKEWSDLGITISRVPQKIATK